MPILSSNTPIIGKCPPVREHCDYAVDVVTSGSDPNDKPYFLTGLQLATELISLPQKVDLRDVSAVQTQLNALNKGTFLVAPKQVATGEVRIEIKSLQNPNDLLGIWIEFETDGTYAGVPKYHKFDKCNCTASTNCDPQEKRCDYQASRQYESSDDAKIRFAGIRFSHGQTFVRPTDPIDTEDLQAIAGFLNGLPEAEGSNKFQVYYAQNTLFVYNRQSVFETMSIVFEVETNLPLGGTDKHEVETFFIKSNCNSCCPEECGRNGQLPCNNGINSGCNPTLSIDPQTGLCRPVCIPGKLWVGNEQINAGGLNQPPDCNGRCNEGLVNVTGIGCQYPNLDTERCDINKTFEANQNYNVVTLPLCKLGTFNAGHILLGDGTALQEWLNADTTGICPKGQQCAVVTREATDKAGIFRYKITFAGISKALFTCPADTQKVVLSGIGCDDLVQCTEATNCSPVNISPTCPIGQVFDNNWLRCIPIPETCNLATGEKLVWTKGDISRISADEMAIYETRIMAEIVLIQNSPVLLANARRWFETHGLPLDLRAEAIARLATKGGNGVPDSMRMSFKKAEGYVLR